MKLRLPWFVIVLAVMAVMALMESGRAEMTVPMGSGAYNAAPNATPVYFHIGALNLTVPWDNVNVVYLFNVPDKTNLVGGEAVFATLWRIQATAGAVTSLEGMGAPFVGGNLWFENPVPQLAILNQIKPGVFGGWDFTRHVPMWGFKAAVSIF
jgi:hypothetical protein